MATHREALWLAHPLKPQLFAENLEENYLIITPIMNWCGLSTSDSSCAYITSRFVREQQMCDVIDEHAFSMCFNTSNISGMW